MDLELMKADIETVAAKVLKRPVTVEKNEVCDQEGESVEGLTVDGFLIVYPVPNLKPTIGGKMVEGEDVAIDILVGGDGQFEEPDQVRHPTEGCIFQHEGNAITEVIGLLAKADAEGHLEAIGEARYLAEQAEAAKGLDGETVPLVLPPGYPVLKIVIQQRTECKHCGGEMPKNSEGWWVRTTDEHKGGLYHTGCIKIEEK